MTGEAAAVADAITGLCSFHLEHGTHVMRNREHYSPDTFRSNMPLTGREAHRVREPHVTYAPRASGPRERQIEVPRTVPAAELAPRGEDMKLAAADQSMKVEAFATNITWLAPVIAKVIDELEEIAVPDCLWPRETHEDILSRFVVLGVGINRCCDLLLRVVRSV